MISGLFIPSYWPFLRVGDIQKKKELNLNLVIDADANFEGALVLDFLFPAIIIVNPFGRHLLMDYFEIRLVN